MAELVEPDPADHTTTLEDIDDVMRHRIGCHTLGRWVVAAHAHEHVHRRDVDGDVVEQDFGPSGDEHLFVTDRDHEVLSFEVHHPLTLEGEVAKEMRSDKQEETFHDPPPMVKDLQAP